MSCPKHKHLEKLLELEEYRDFKPYAGEEKDGFGNSHADMVRNIRRERGEKYYQENKKWLWSKLAWEMYLNVAR